MVACNNISYNNNLGARCEASTLEGRIGVCGQAYNITTSYTSQSKTGATATAPLFILPKSAVRRQPDYTAMPGGWLFAPAKT